MAQVKFPSEKHVFQHKKPRRVYNLTHVLIHIETLFHPTNASMHSLHTYVVSECM